MDKVSIIVPIYKVEKYLRECLDSIVSQTYSNLQIILVDDGSPDNCGVICDEYAERDNRIVVLHCNNGGLSVARNRGLQVCEGAYVLFVDSDDYLEENAVKILCDHMKKDNLDILFYDALSFDETSTNVPETEIEKYIRKYDYSCVRNGPQMFLDFLKNDEYRSPVQYCFFKRTFLSENDLTFHEGIVHEDEEFTFLSLLCAQKVKHISDVLYYHRFRSDSIMGAKTTQKNVDGCYGVVLTVINNSDKFLNNPQTEKAYTKGVARLVEILFSRIRAIDNKKFISVKQLRDVKKRLRYSNYFDSAEVKMAAFDMKHKRMVCRKIKIHVYSLVSPLLCLFRRK